MLRDLIRKPLTLSRSHNPKNPRPRRTLNPFLDACLERRVLLANSPFLYQNDGDPITRAIRLILQSIQLGYAG